MAGDTKLPSLVAGTVNFHSSLNAHEPPVVLHKIDVSDNGEAVLDMTLTAPNCPAADFIMEDIRQKVESVEGVTTATINLVFEPEWDKDMMSEEAKLELGFL